MGVNRKTLMSEVEDSMRKQGGAQSEINLRDLTRQEIIDTAAWLLLAVESGDRNAAEAQKAY